jgi:hypothetical protein
MGLLQKFSHYLQARNDKVPKKRKKASDNVVKEKSEKA